MPESQLIVAAMLNLTNFYPLLKSKMVAIACTALQILRTPLQMIPLIFNFSQW